MRRARRWVIAFVAPLILAGCASSSDVGGESFTAEDGLWTVVYIGAIVLGVVGAKVLVEANE
jgi:outer membrane lipoprotein SlyB